MDYIRRNFHPADGLYFAFLATQDYLLLMNLWMLPIYVISEVYSHLLFYESKASFCRSYWLNSGRQRYFMAAFMSVWPAGWCCLTHCYYMPVYNGVGNIVANIGFAAICSILVQVDRIRNHVYAGLCASAAPDINRADLYLVCTILMSAFIAGSSIYVLGLILAPRWAAANALVANNTTVQEAAPAYVAQDFVVHDNIAAEPNYEVMTPQYDVISTYAPPVYAPLIATEPPPLPSSLESEYDAQYGDQLTPLSEESAQATLPQRDTTLNINPQYQNVEPPAEPVAPIKRIPKRGTLV